MKVLRTKILVVDDEQELTELLKDYLEREQFEVITCGEGEEAIALFKRYEPQLIVLDVMLPKLSGIEVCRMIRAESSVPIIMLSAKKSEVDKILGLGIGADDYVVKPFSPSEVVARVKAQLRRFQQLSRPEAVQSTVWRYGEIEIDAKAYEVKLKGRPIEFSAKEFELLLFMAKHPNQVFSREQIFENVWGYGDYGDLNTVTVHVKKLRSKLEADPANPDYIKTVWGVGYKFSGGER